MSAFTDWRDTGKSFSFKGFRVFFQQHGKPADGDVLLCLHGFPTASWDWHAIWPGLCERFACVIAPDFLGFGYSDKPRGHDYSIMEQADLCQALLTQLGITRCHLLAHDFGDTVAQELLARDLGRRAGAAEGPEILSCVMLNGGLFPESHRMRPIQRLLLTPMGPLLASLSRERQFSRGLAAVFGARTQPDATALHEFWLLNAHQDGRKNMHRLIRYIPERRQHRMRWVGALTATPVPLRFINGPSDPVSGRHMAARYRELVPNPDVVMLRDDIGHYPQVEAPEATLQGILAFHA